MIHEYARQYNEVLRGYSQQRLELTATLEAQAHEHAMQWVRNIWKYADPQRVQQSLTSQAFASAIAAIRTQQRTEYPALRIIH